MAGISANQIRITLATAEHINKTFMARLRDENADINIGRQNLENNILNALKIAITNGMVLRNFPAEDMHNPSDRILEIYVDIDLASIDQKLEGNAGIKVLCRLSAAKKILTLRTIQKNFSIEVERDYGSEPQIEYDQEIDYPDYDG